MIKFIQIHNFKSLQDVFIELKPINILYGLNGMGKSSFIQAFLLLKQSLELVSEAENIFLNGAFVKLGLGEDVFCDSGDDLEGIKFRFTFDEDSFGVVIDYTPELNNSNFLPVSSVENKDLLFETMRKLRYISSLRITPKTYFEASEFDVKNRTTIGIGGEYTAHFLSENKRKKISPNRVHCNSQTDELLENCENWLREISPLISISAKTEFDLNISKIRYSFYQDNYRTKEFKPLNVGFGITHVLPIVVQLLITEPDSLLIIENPEPHIHPKGLEKLVELFFLSAKDGVQIIIETHSNELIQALKTNPFNKEIEIGLNYFYRSLNSHTTEITTHELEVLPNESSIYEFLSTSQVDYEDLKKRVFSNNNTTIITEGKTDWKILKFVFILLKKSGKYPSLNIDFLEYNDGDMGDGELRKLRKRLQQSNFSHKIIFLFDRDKSPFYDTEQKYEINSNNIFTCVLPVPLFRKGDKNICIELMFPNNVLLSTDSEDRRLFLTSEFNDLGRVKNNLNLTIYGRQISRADLEESSEKILDGSNCQITDGRTSSFCLTKNDFSNLILDSKIELNIDDLVAFDYLFSVFEEIDNRD